MKDLYRLFLPLALLASILNAAAEMAQPATHGRIAAITVSPAHNKLVVPEISASSEPLASQQVAPNTNLVYGHIIITPGNGRGWGIPRSEVLPAVPATPDPIVMPPQPAPPPIESIPVPPVINTPEPPVITHDEPITPETPQPITPPVAVPFTEAPMMITPPSGTHRLELPQTPSTRFTVDTPPESLATTPPPPVHDTSQPKLIEFPAAENIRLSLLPEAQWPEVPPQPASLAIPTFLPSHNGRSYASWSTTHHAPTQRLPTLSVAPPLTGARFNDAGWSQLFTTEQKAAQHASSAMPAKVLGVKARRMQSDLEI